MQIRFSFETIYGTFSDALNLPDDHNHTESEILLMQEQRRDNWILYIESESNNTNNELVINEVINDENNPQ